MKNRYCDTCQRRWKQPSGQRRFDECPTCRTGRYSAAQKHRWDRHRRDVEAKAWATRQPASLPRPDLDALMAALDGPEAKALKAAETGAAFLKRNFEAMPKFEFCLPTLGKAVEAADYGPMWSIVSLRYQAFQAEFAGGLE